MFDTAQRLSVVLEQHDDDQDWTVAAILIDERGRRKRATLGRYPDREAAAERLEALFEQLQIRQKIGA